MRRALTIVSLLLMTAGLCSAQNALGPGVVELPFIAGQHYDAGTVKVHNTNGGLIVEVELANGWQMAELQAHVGWADNPVPMKSGNPSPGKFDFKYEFDPPQNGKEIYFDFDEDLEGFRWGEPWEPERLRHMAIHADVVILDGNGEVIQEEGAWAQGNIEFDGGEWGWWFLYPFTHKAKVHFVDSPVEGLRLVSPGAVVETLRSRQAVSLDRMDTLTRMALQIATDADHLFTGVVEIYKPSPTVDPDPHVSFSARLLAPEAMTGPR